MTEFKVAVIKKLADAKENSERQFKELRNEIDEQKQYFTKKTKLQEMNQTKMLQLKNSIKETNPAESTGNGVDKTEQGISDLEDRNLEMTQEEGERELS